MQEVALGRIHVRRGSLKPDTAASNGHNFAIKVSDLHPDCKFAALIADKVTGATSYSGYLWGLFHGSVAAGATISCVVIYVT